MKLIYNILILLLLVSCIDEREVITPDFGQGGFLSETYPLTVKIKNNLEGVYTIENGTNDFGTKAVFKWDGEYMSVFAEKNAAFMIMKGGQIDSVMIFEGYWRFATSVQTGLIRLSVRRSEGGRELVLGQVKEDGMIVRGAYGKGKSLPDRPVIFRYVRPLNKNKDFFILAHRGGGRNSDMLGASENSLGIIKLAGKLGANGIEIDVRLTKDNMPILYHDDNLNNRLIDGEFLVGSVTDYNYMDIYTFGRLKNGEHVPTLKQALEVVLEYTNLRVVWLDMKTPGSMKYVFPLVQDYLKRSIGKGKKLYVVIGLPSDEIYNELLSISNYEKIPSLCELSIDKVRKANSIVWAPRWTLGMLTNEVAEMHAENRLVFVWTLDDRKFIKEYINNADFDGILTNYPTIVAYEYYTKD